MLFNKLTIADLESPEMSWKKIESESIKYFGKNLPDFETWFNNKMVSSVFTDQFKAYMEKIFKSISQATGIPLSQIKEFYSEKCPPVGEFISGNAPDFMHEEDLKKIDLAFRVPDVEDYIYTRKVENKTTKGGKKDNIVQLLNDCTLEEKELVLFLFWGYMGAGNNTGIVREWKRLMSQEDIDGINETYLRVQSIIQTTSTITRKNAEKATIILTELNDKSILMQSRFEVIEQLEKSILSELENQQNRNRELLKIDEIDPKYNEIEELILALKAIIRLQQAYNTSVKIEKLQSEEAQYIREGRDFLGEFYKKRFLDNGFSRQCLITVLEDKEEEEVH